MPNASLVFFFFPWFLNQFKIIVNQAMFFISVARKTIKPTELFQFAACAPAPSQSLEVLASVKSSGKFSCCAYSYKWVRMVTDHVHTAFFFSLRYIFATVSCVILGY